MIHLFLYLHSFEELRSKCDIDMSKIPADKLADECDSILQHHKKVKLFFGYLDVGWMLDPKHEARIRNAIRKFEVYIVTFHLDSIPFSWKNEIDTLYVKRVENGGTEIIDNGCPVQPELEAEN
jgi:hypothetical protein